MKTTPLPWPLILIIHFYTPLKSHLNKVTYIFKLINLDFSISWSYCLSNVVWNNIEAKQRRRRRRKAKNDGDDGMGKKRKLREDQVSMLESSFGCEHKLESKRKDQLAAELGLDPRQVAVWFQNRRARWKNKRLEDEYSKLRALHDTALIEKCNLENQV